MKLSNNYSIQGFKGKEQEQQQVATKKVNGFIPRCVSGVVAAVPIFVTDSYADKVALPKLRKYSELPADTVNLVHEKSREVIKNVGLDKHGVTIELLPKLKKIPDVKTMLKNPILQVNAGLNSVFLAQNLKTVDELGEKISYKKNTIFLPERKSCLTVFHEMGHAANFNKAKLTKCLLIGNAYGQKLAFLPVIFGVLTRKSKPDENGNLTTGQKVKNFVRDNAGKISFACMVPALIEEGLASIRANRYAKEYLSPELLKKVNKTNIWAYSTYVMMTIALTLAAKIGVEMKDKMIANKEAKALEKMNAKTA